jgi:hypothetical protein
MNTVEVPALFVLHSKLEVPGTRKIRQVDD